MDLFSNYFSGLATIFMLHRVSPIDPYRLAPNENMKVSPQYLDQFLVTLKRVGYHFVSLDELHDSLKKGTRERKRIVFTLDDGYADNYDIALDIFKSHDVPFTVYLTTSFCDKNAIMWWYIIEDLILQNDNITLSNGMIFRLTDVSSRVAAFLEIRRLVLMLDQFSLIDQLNSLFSNYSINWYSKCAELALTWEQVIDLTKCGLVTIGAHTKNHFALKKLEMNVMNDEVSGSIKLIEEKIERKVEHFAYPYGGRPEAGLREFSYLKDIGIKTSTTTRHGNIHAQHRGFLQALPRVMLTEKFLVNDIGRFSLRRVVKN